MSTIRFHQDLKVFQKSFEVAMVIMNYQNISQKKNVILLQTK
jgi:hypothetical protein